MEVISREGEWLISNIGNMKIEADSYKDNWKQQKY